MLQKESKQDTNIRYLKPSCGLRTQLEKNLLPLLLREMSVQGYLGDIVGSVPDHRNKVSTAIKCVVIFLLTEDLAINL